MLFLASLKQFRSLLRIRFLSNQDIAALFLRFTLIGSPSLGTGKGPYCIPSSSPTVCHLIIPRAPQNYKSKQRFKQRKVKIIDSISQNLAMLMLKKWKQINFFLLKNWSILKSMTIYTSTLFFPTVEDILNEFVRHLKPSFSTKYS